MQERVYDFNEGEKLFSGSISTLNLMASNQRQVLPFVDPEQQFEFVNSLDDRYKNYIFQSPEEVKVLGDSFSSQIKPVNFKKLALAIIDSLILFPLVISQLIVDYVGPSNQSLDVVLKDFSSIDCCAHVLTKVAGMLAEYDNLRQLKVALQALSRDEKTFTLTSHFVHLYNRKLPGKTSMYALNWVVAAANSTYIYTPTHTTCNNYFKYAATLRADNADLTLEQREKFEDLDYSLWCFVQLIMFNHLVNTTSRFTFYLTPEMEKHLYSRVKRKRKENNINGMDAEQKYEVPKKMQRVLALLELKKYSKLTFHKDHHGYDITLGREGYDHITDLDRREMLQEIIEKTILSSTISFFTKSKAELLKIALGNTINERHFSKLSDIQSFMDQVIVPLTKNVDLINNMPFQQMLTKLSDKLNSFFLGYQSTSSL